MNHSQSELKASFSWSPVVLESLSQGVGGGRLLFKGRYGCAVSAKPMPGKISPKNLMSMQKSAQKPNDRANFHEL